MDCVHLTFIPKSNYQPNTAYYIPFHYVIKLVLSGPQIRDAFDGDLQCWDRLCITCNFVPPGSAFMNILAEAGVNSLKTHPFEGHWVPDSTFDDFYTSLLM